MGGIPLHIATPWVEFMSSVKELFESMEYGPALEDASLAKQWILEQGPSFGHWINGQWRLAKTQFDSINPATGEVLANIGQGNNDDIDAAVRAAREALESWQALSADTRARHLYALARQVQKHARILAVL